MNNASITYNSNAPIFRWSLQSGNTQKFILEIDYLGNGTYKTISMSGGNTYQLSSTDWESIKNDAPFIGNGIKQIKWRIKINYSIYPNEAPYCTDWYAFTITGCPVTTQETLPIIAANNRYTEKVIYLDSGKYKDLYVTFATGGNRVIQTFGTKDTVLELYASDGSKLLGQSDTDDNGYSNNALLSYNFTANVTYRIRVQFYSSSQYGNTKLTIVPTYNHDSYDSAYGTYGTTTVSWSLSNNRVALFRYKFDSDGLATFKMSASSDTYLYIIDPTSTEIIAQYANSNYDVDNMYDDDSGGNYQAKITKRVQANKEYLVIISFYNPNTMSGEFSITSSLSPTLIPMPI